MKKILSIMVLFLLMPIAFALGNTEDDYFWEKNTLTPITNVDMVMYQCNDEQCASVVPTPVFTGNSGATNSLLNIPIPYSETYIDYAQYFFAEGYKPIGYKLSDNIGDGNHEVYNINFSKVEACNAPIENLVILNANQAFQNEPLLIDAAALLNSTTYSAFHSVNNVPFFIPDVYKEEYFSAQTLITLTITDSQGNVENVNTSQVNIYMDENQEVQFSWTPEQNGTYEILLTTDVIDNQCNFATASQHSTRAVINVRPERAINKCEVLLNGLSSNNNHPFVGEEIEFTFSKINYCADAVGDKTAVPLNVDYNIRTGKISESGVTIAIDPSSEVLPATSLDIPTQYGFNWIPTNSGWYTITLDATSDISANPSYETVGDTRQIEIQIQDYPTYDVYFILTDRDTNAPIENARVDLNGIIMYSSNDGRITFEDLYEAPAYSYEITHGDYQTITGTFALSGRDEYINIPLIKVLSASSNGPYTCTVGDTITLSGAATGGTTPYTFAWDLDNDGTFESSGTSVNYACSSEGTYSVSVTATDSLSITDTDSTTVTVASAPVPTLISVPNGPYSCTVGDTITLSGSATGGVSPYSFAWDLDNDGTFESSGASVNFACTSTGTFDINLQTTDSVSVVDTDSTTVTVASAPVPTLTSVPNGPYSCTVGDTITLTGSATGGVLPYTFAWDLDNDGTFESSGASVNFACTSTGTFDINLQTTDSSSTTDVGATTITVTDTPTPGALTSVSNGPYTCNLGDTITLTGFATGGVSPYIFSWDLDNDGTFESSGASVNFACNLAGTFDISLQTTDSVSVTDTDSTTITVTDTPTPSTLIAVSNGPYTCTIGNTITLTGSATGGVSPYTFAWDLDNDGTFESSGQSVNFACTSTGTFDISLQTTDSSSTTNIDSTTITINPKKEAGPDPLPLWKKQRGNSRELVIQNININNQYEVYSGDYLDISVTIKNKGSKTLKNSIASIWIPDLGVYRSVGPFSLRPNKQVSKGMTVFIPDAKPGIYDLKLSVGNDKVKRGIYREILVTD